MIPRFFGAILGHIVTFIHWAWKSGIGYIRYVVMATAVVILLPPVTEYWLSHVRLPDVPVSAIVAMFAASLLLLSFGSAMFVLLSFARQIVQTERATATGGSIGQFRPSFREKATDGTFTPVDDATAWAREEMNLLQEQGFLTKTDREEIDAIAKEEGIHLYEAFIKKRGRTA